MTAIQVDFLKIWLLVIFLAVLPVIAGILACYTAHVQEKIQKNRRRKK